MISLKNLDELRTNLPSEKFLRDHAEDLDVRTRAVLSLMFRDGLIDGEVTPIESDPTSCPNCGVQVQSTRSPYCSSTCREVSAFIRQFRSGVEERTVFDAERQAALGQKLWFVLGGGYPRREALVPAKVILKVIEREGAKCEQCGALATTIDHSGSG